MSQGLRYIMSQRQVRSASKQGSYRLGLGIQEEDDESTSGVGEATSARRRGGGGRSITVAASSSPLTAG
ncbi:hypothetical protein LINPERPRIM_LOCUS18758 [Linum perenne]